MKTISSTAAITVGVASIAVFLGYMFFVSNYERVAIVGEMIGADVKKLAFIFERIHQTCVISSFDYQKNPINFLNVGNFISSEIGPMNLVHPDKWEGPYIEDNLNVQSIEYQVVKTKFGYFITPGEGVELPNGKIIGKDIILNEDADILKMMGSENYLRYGNMPLAAPISLQREVGGQTRALLQAEDAW